MMMTKAICAAAIAALLVPFTANAQTPSPPTDAQSKRQQESPVVNNSAGTAGAATTTGNAPAPTLDGTANTTIKTDPPITSTSPAGANPDAVTGGKTEPLAPKN